MPPSTPAANPNPVVSPPPSNPAATPAGSQVFEAGSSFSIPDITPRSSEDHVVLDALKFFLVDMPLDEMIHEVKSIIDIETMLNASPVLVFTLYRLFEYKGLNFEDRFTGQPVKSILADTIYSDEYVEYLAANINNSSSRDTSKTVEQKEISKVTIRQASTSDLITTMPISGHFSRARVTPLPLRNAKGVHGRVGDLIKYYSSPNARYSGRPSDNQSLSMHHTAYYNQAHLCCLTADQGLKALINMMEPQSLAAHFYFSEIVDKCETLEQAFDKLYQWDRHHSTLDGLLRQWRHLKVATFKNEHVTWPKAMELLYERAVMIQAQLDPVHQHPIHLIEVLEASIRDQPFYMFVQRSSAAHDAHAYFQDCLNAIAKQEDMEQIATRQRLTEKYRFAGLLLQNPTTATLNIESRLQAQQKAVNAAYIPSVDSKNPTSEQPSVTQMKRENLKAAFYSHAGRRYAYNNQRRGGTKRPNGKNPIGSDGTVMLCRGCGSDSHFVRDCTARNKAKVIAFVANEIGNDVLELPMDDLLDTIQDIPSEVWEVHVTRSQDMDLLEEKEQSEMEVKEAMYTHLSDVSIVHALLGAKNVFSSSTDKDNVRLLSKSNTPKVVSKEALDSAITKKGLEIPPSAKEKKQISTLETVHSMDPNDNFEGIMLDNGAAGTPSGLPAFLRYCKFVGVEPKLKPSIAKFVGVGKGIVPSMGSAIVRMPVGQSYLNFKTDVVEQDIPLMFGLDQHKLHGCSSDEYNNTFTHHPSNTTIPVEYKNGHLWVVWPTTEVLFTNTELKKLHDRFGHPSAKALINLLKRARPQDCTPDTRKKIQELTSRCRACQTFAQKPSTFRVSMPHDDIVFNHEIEVDLFWIEGKAAIHIIDRGTRYSVTKLLEHQTAEYLWNIIIEAWVTVFTGFPNIIAHDRGNNFSSDFFRNACTEFGITISEKPVESHNSLSLCERYHSIIRRVFRKLRMDFPRMNRETLLSLSTHAVNTTAGPDGLTPSLLVFGAIPRLPIGNLYSIPPSQKDRFKAMKLAREEMNSITAERRIKQALLPGTRSPQPFIPKEGDLVRVYRERRGKFEGPYKVHAYDNRKTVSLIVPNARGREEIVPFSLSIVKPYESAPTLTEGQESDIDALLGVHRDTSFTSSDFNRGMQQADRSFLPTAEDIISDLHEINTQQQNQVLYNEHQAAEAYPSVIISDPYDSRFDEAKVLELQNLLDKGTYKIVPEIDVPKNGTVLNSRFVLSIKNPKSSSPLYKARFIIQGHKDPDKGRVVSEAPTVLRSSVRLILALSMIFKFPLWSRDVSQAFVQSEENLKRKLYIRAPVGQKVLEILGAPPNSLLQAIKPLYGLPESPTYWWVTFSRFHMEDMGLQQAVMDPCLFYDNNENGFEGAQVTLVDDTLGTGNKTFSEKETIIGERFLTKKRQNNLPIQFNGCLIESQSNSLRMQQTKYSNGVASPGLLMTAEEFATLRGKLAYVSASTRPDLSFYSARLAQCKAQNAEKSDFKFLNEAIELLKEPHGLVYPELDITSMKIVAYSDASFATNYDLSSQLGAIILLQDESHSACIIHYASWKCRRVTRSVLAAEVYAFSSCLDWTLTFAHDLRCMTGLNLPVVLMTDSKSLFDTVTKLTTVREKRLLIDISCIRESYRSGELTNVAHVSSEYNLADSFTKRSKSTLLHGVMDNGYLNHPINQWIISPEES